MSPRAPEKNEPWLVLLPQFDRGQSTLRVRIWRRLQQLGAIALKNGAYVLPADDDAREDAEWVLRELRDHGGDGMLLAARVIDGASDAALVAQFNRARDEEYAALAREARAPRGAVAAADALPKLQRRLARIVARDRYGAAGREAGDAALDALARRAGRGADHAPTGSRRDELPPAGTTWVTREGVHVDRMACAWLIRRFVDPKARLKFVAASGYSPRKGEVRYDMYEAEFTHRGSACSFEVLLAALGSRDPALKAIAEIVHELDVKDDRYARPEAPGVGALLDAIAATDASDSERVARAAAIFDGLYDACRR